MSDAAATISISGLAQAASAPQAAGQMRPSARALAPIAAGSTPATAAIEPSRPSSPSTVKPERASGTPELRRTAADPDYACSRLTSPLHLFRLRSPRFVVNPCIIHGYHQGSQMRPNHRLTARQVATATLPEGENKDLLHDGSGLYLQLMRSVSGDAINKSWLFKFELHGKRREMGLGSLQDFTLAEARQRHRALRQQVSDGIDPLEERRQRDAERAAEAAKTMTFRDCFKACLASHEGSWRNAEHRRQWRTSI